jgi:hypothetical protein
LEDKKLMAKPPNSALQPVDTEVLGEELLKANLPETQKTSLPPETFKLETLVPQLYNLESSYSEPEESLPLDLGLDQIEDYQE